MHLRRGYKGNLIKATNSTVDIQLIRTYNSRQSLVIGLVGATRHCPPASV